MHKPKKIQNKERCPAQTLQNVKLLESLKLDETKLSVGLEILENVDVK